MKSVNGPREVRLTVEDGAERIDTLHHDQLGSVIGISNPSGVSAETRAYHPFGKVAISTITDLTLTAEDKGFTPLSAFDSVKHLSRQRGSGMTRTRGCST